MKYTTPALLCFALLIQPIAAYACDDLYDRIKDTENFQKADAVFVGRITDFNISGPVRIENGKSGPVCLHAFVKVKKSFKGNLNDTVCIQNTYTHSEYRKMSSPPLKEEEYYLIFGRKNKLSGYGGKGLERFRIDNGTCYSIIIPLQQLIKEED